MDRYLIGTAHAHALYVIPSVPVTDGTVDRARRSMDSRDGGTDDKRTLRGYLAVKTRCGDLSRQLRDA
jgi:hypothetical protein